MRYESKWIKSFKVDVPHQQQQINNNNKVLLFNCCLLQSWMQQFQQNEVRTLLANSNLTEQYSLMAQAKQKIVRITKHLRMKNSYCLLATPPSCHIQQALDEDKQQ